MDRRGTIVELQRNFPNWSNIVESVVKLEKKTFPKHESLARSFDEELRKKNSGLLYVVLDGEVAGYVMYSWPSSLCASITKLAVKENFRRQGYGEALLKAAIDKCRTRNVQRISLHVDPSRTPAMNLYKKLGFTVDNLIEGYYSSDRNAYRMYLEFRAEWYTRDQVLLQLFPGFLYGLFLLYFTKRTNDRIVATGIITLSVAQK